MRFQSTRGVVAVAIKLFSLLLWRKLQSTHVKKSLPRGAVRAPCLKAWGRTWSQVSLPRPLLAARSKLRTAPKRLSRCEQGSKNREKARSRVAHICQQVTDMRTDFLQKWSTPLIHKNQVILVETLGTKNLLKNRRLARAISDAGFGEFVRMLEYKCKGHGRTWSQVWLPRPLLAARSKLRTAQKR